MSDDEENNGKGDERIAANNVSETETDNDDDNDKPTPKLAQNVAAKTKKRGKCGKTTAANHLSSSDESEKSFGNDEEEEELDDINLDPFVMVTWKHNRVGQHTETSHDNPMTSQSDP